MPRNLEGYSWKTRLEGKRELVEKDVFIEWSPGSGMSDEVDHPIRTVVTPDGWKLNWSSFGQHELYDLNEDPLESTNLIRHGSHRPLVENLFKRIRAWQLRVKDVVELPKP